MPSLHSLSMAGLLFLGCSSQLNGVTGAGIDARPGRTPDAQPSSGGDSGADASNRYSCPGPGYATPASDQTLLHVSATVVDEAGNTVPNMLAQACGVNVCVNGTTNANGLVVIDTQVQEQEPAFKYGDGKTHAKFALSLGSGSPIKVDLGKEATVAFDPPASGSPLTRGTVASSRGVELDLPLDMNPIEPDPFDFDSADLRKFRAATVSTDTPPAAVDASLGFGIIVALTPVGTELCPAAKLTVPNSANFPAGSRVDVFLHGIDVAEAWAPYAGWAKVSDAAVSMDGKTVVTVEGGGLPALSVVGLRLAK